MDEEEIETDDDGLRKLYQFANELTALADEKTKRKQKYYRRKGK